MSTRKTPINLSEYMPDEATARAMAEESVEYNKNVDPKLLARLEELRRNSSPSLPRVAPPSDAAYVAPTATPANNVTLPRVAKVNVVPLRESDRETQPSLKRLEGEPELAGVERRRVPAPVSLRTAVLAVLAVLAPVVLVVVLMGREKRQPGGAATAVPSATAKATATAVPSATATAVPSATATASTTATAEPSTVPAVVPTPPVPAQPVRPRAMAPDDPYDAAPPAATAPSVTAQPSAAPAVAPAPPTPSAAPPAVKSAAPTAPTAPDILP